MTKVTGLRSLKSMKARTCPHCITNEQAASELSTTADSAMLKKTIRPEMEKKSLVTRCNRIEGQIRGVKGMISEDIYCDDILNQIAAARAALDGLGRLLLERHMKSCLISGIRSGDDAIIDELLVTLSRMMK